jgi:hypothetical protein
MNQDRITVIHARDDDLGERDAVEGMRRVVFKVQLEGPAIELVNELNGGHHSDLSDIY